MERWGSGDELAVAGLTEALSALPTATSLAARLALALARPGSRPQLAVLIDSPGINLRLAWLCKRAGVPVLQVVAPQRWAWLGWRAKTLSKLLDGLAVTLPFEQAWFRSRGVNATFVGHPLVDQGDVPHTRRPNERPLLGLFPGSRRHEIARHLPLMREVATTLRGERALEVRVAVADEAMARRCAELAPDLRPATAAEVLTCADVALAASGTITLELALADVPQVVLYRLSALSAAAARLLLSVDRVALPNLLCDREVVCELLQDDATPVALGSGVRRLLDDPAAQQAQRDAYAELRATLGPPGFARRVADLAEGLLDTGGRSGVSRWWGRRC